MGLETLKIIGLELKPYAVREWNAPLFGEEPNIADVFKAFKVSSTQKTVLVGPPGLEPGTSAL